MFLDHIVTQTSIDLEQRKRELPPETLQRLAVRQPEPRDLLAALRDKRHVRLIAEVKRASPSKGLLAPHLDPVALARTYEAKGAAAISVLTEPHSFLGSPEHLLAIKQAVSVPVLRKDFIIDEYQVYESRAWGADAILLICAILDDIQAMRVSKSLVVSQDIPAQMRSLLRGANEDIQVKICGLRTPEHMRAAIDAGADMLGLMFYEPSPRYIEPHQARALLESIENDSVGDDLSRPPAQSIAPDIVGVFVNKDAAYINEVAQQVGLHIVQLHGGEPPEFCHSITRPVV